MPCCIVIIAFDGVKKHEIYQKTSLEISDRSLVYTTQLRLFLFSQRNRHYNAIKQVFYILIFFCSSIYEKMIATIRQMKKWIENLIKYKNLVSVRCNCRHAQRVHFYQYSIVCGEYSFFHREIYIFGISLLTLNQINEFLMEFVMR